MPAIIITIAVFAAYLFVMWSNFWCKIPYEGTEDEIITKTWGGENEDDYEVRFVPLYKNWWGRIYYGEYTQDWLSGEWKRVHYFGGFGGDPDLFTTRRIYHDARFHEDFIGRQILKERKHSNATEEWMNNLTEEKRNND